MSGDFNTAIMNETAHRPWPLPDAPWVMTQTWNDLLFAHWPVDPEQLRAEVPLAFTLDLFERKAWVAIVPFHMTNVALRGVPSIRRMSEFPEMNVRTYVRVGDRPGVYFFSLDAASAMAVRVARLLLNLPYWTAAMSAEVRGERVEYYSQRNADPSAVLAANYGPAGHPVLAARDSLEYFLTERYCLYHLDRRGSPYRLEIHHPPWKLQPAHAQLTRNTMGAASGLTLPEHAPLLHFAKRQDVVVWTPHRLR